MMVMHIVRLPPSGCRHRRRFGTGAPHPHMGRAKVEPVERIFDLAVYTGRRSGIDPHVHDRQHFLDAYRVRSSTASSPSAFSVNARGFNRCLRREGAREPIQEVPAWAGQDVFECIGNEAGTLK